jgi:hypothetical protein
MEYGIGDIVSYGNFLDQRRLVLVEGKEDDIKNGRPGFYGQLVDRETMEPLNSGDPIGDGVWGYDYQIVDVLKQSQPVE